MNSKYQEDESTIAAPDAGEVSELLRADANPDGAGMQIRIPGFAWPIIGKKVSEAIQKRLHSKVLNSLASSWQKAPELGKFADEQKYPHGEPWTVSLGEHEIEFSLFPVVKITYGGAEIGEKKFEAALVAEIVSVELEVSSGEITSIGVATFSMKGQLKYGLKYTPIKSKDYKLTDPYKFDPPLKIFGGSDAQKREGSRQVEMI